MEDNVPVRVVLVDDEAPVRALLGITLGLEPDHHFLVVGEATDGDEAVEIIKSEHPDAVVLDLIMPRKGGMDVIAAIRRCSPDTKIVVFSAADAVAMSAEALAQGAHAYIDKHRFIQELTDTLDRLCSC
jgi:DNA-binding NarL/FixJ family response regulator